MSHSRSRLEQFHSTAITKGLKAALADASIDGSITQYSDPHIKVNKLMYMAAAEKDLLDELQHSWHIYGSDLGDLVPHPQSVTPIELQQLPPTPSPNNIPTGPSPVGLYDESEFYDVFRDMSLGDYGSLEEILEANRVDLLNEFYDEYSDHIGDFYDIYSYNLRLQGLFESHMKNIDVGRIGLEEYERLNRFTRDMRDEFLKHEEFSPGSVEDLGVDLEHSVSQMFLDFLDLVDDIYFYLSQKQGSEVDGDVSHIISELEAFYLNQAWKAVTEIISFHTIRGPRAEGLEHGAKVALKLVDENHQIKFDSLISECEGANILPVDPASADFQTLSPEEELEMLESSDLLRD